MSNSRSDKHKTKTMLIVSYHFPPDAAVGGLRASKFAKYLPACGWDPIILTVRESYYPRTDDSKLRDLKNIREIHRTTMIPHTSQLYRKLKTLFPKRRSETQSVQPIHPPRNDSKVIRSLKTAFFSLEYLPDDKQVWIPVATINGLKIVKQKKVDCIFTSGPPMSSHVIGLLLKRLTGLRWIADFRDPWLTNPGKSPETSTALADTFQAWLEKKTVLIADKVVAATDRIEEDLNRRYPSIRPKTQVILNGYDAEDFDGCAVPAVPHDPRKFTLTHTGSMYRARSAEPFLIALSDLIESGEIARDRVRVNFIGSSPGIESQAEAWGLKEVFTIMDFMDYQRCIQHLYSSDALLLFAQDQPMQIPGKFYDYIAVQKPILIFTSDGATSDLAKKINCGTIVDPTDRGLIREKVKDLYNKFESGELRTEGNKDFVVELTKEKLTQELVKGID